MRPIASLLAAASLALLSACTPPAQEAETTAPEQAAAAPLTPAGEAAELARIAVDSNLSWAASVVQLDILTNEANGGVKLFGVAGGDPAMNGLYTYIAFFENPGSGWRVFQLGDFLNYRVVSEAPGRVDLEISESTMDEATGNIGSRTRYVIVSWARGADDAPPMTISVTPAQQGS
jgi:hypothetical protein